MKLTFKPIWLGAGIALVLVIFAFIISTRKGTFGNTPFSDNVEPSKRIKVPISSTSHGGSNTHRGHGKNINSTARISPDQLFRFSQEGFEHTWEYVLKNSESEQDRLVILRQIAIRMTSLGGTEDAIRAIQRDFGEGNSRASLIAACIAHSTDPSKLHKYYDLLSTTSERTHALRAIPECLARDMLSKNGVIDINSYDLEFVGDQQSKVLVDAAGKYALWDFKTTGNTNALASVMGMDLGEINKLKILSEFSDISPMDAWTQLQTIDLSEIPDTSNERYKIISKMVRTDPETSIQEIIQAGHPKDLSRAMMEWGFMDIDKSTLWLKNQSVGLSKDQIDQAWSGLGSALAIAGNIAEAAKVVSLISNSEERSKVEGRIWTAERNNIIRDTRSNPSATVESIVSGESPYAPYWIETAMNEWVAKDSDAAWAWYESNRKSLTPEQNEAIALSYARQALKSGQTDEAVDWSRFVVTPKFQAKIRAEIEAAAKDGQ